MNIWRKFVSLVRVISWIDRSLKKPAQENKDLKFYITDHIGCWQGERILLWNTQLMATDTALGAMKKLRIPPLAVGIGIYLPMSATFAVVVGAVIGHWYDKRARLVVRMDAAPVGSGPVTRLDPPGIIAESFLPHFLLASFVAWLIINGFKRPELKPL